MVWEDLLIVLRTMVTLSCWQVPAATLLSAQFDVGEPQPHQWSGNSSAAISLMLLRMYVFQRAGPGRPRLVAITITPLAASVPYSVVAEGPFTTSMDSMSAGLRSFRRLVASLKNGPLPSDPPPWLGRIE